MIGKSSSWEEHFDPESQCDWYYNTVTGESMGKTIGLGGRGLGRNQTTISYYSNLRRLARMF